jgi:hypothetical protein
MEDRSSRVATECTELEGDNREHSIPSFDGDLAGLHLILITQFKFKRIRDGNYNWTAESEYRNRDRYRTFLGIGKTLADVKRFAEIVRWCERTSKIDDLSWQLVALEEETGIETTWGGDF